MKRVKIYTVSVLLLVTLLITLLSGCYSASSVMKRNPEAEKMGFSVISIENSAKNDTDKGYVAKENYKKYVKSLKNEGNLYAIQLERNEENVKYSNFYIKAIGNKDFYKKEDMFTGGRWIAKKDAFVLGNCSIPKNREIVTAGNRFYDDIEFAFLTAEQTSYIESIECDDVAIWEEIKKISDKVIKWNI